MKKHNHAFIALFAFCSLAYGAGTATTVLHGSTTGNGTYSKVVLTTDVSGLLPLTNLATQAANTVTGNATSGVASPTALAVPSCSTASSALTWTTNTGFGCNSITASAGNLTGPITSVGLATSIASQTGTGTTFVVSGSPTITTPTLTGITNASNAAAGNVGEVLSATVALGSAVSLTTNTAVNVMSISLTAGDWMCSGVINTTVAATTVLSQFQYGFGTTSATLPPDTDYAQYVVSTTGAITLKFVMPQLRVNVSSTTPTYMIARATFTTSTMNAYGQMNCRRVR